jgi:allantoin racemase
MKEKTRVLIIIPVLYNKEIEKDLKEEISRFDTEDIEINYKFVEKGPASIETAYDEETASPAVLSLVQSNLDKGWNAFIVDCFMGPGVEAAREITEIPVIHIGEISIYIAMALGQTFAFVDILSESIPISLRMIKKMGVIDSLSSVINVNVPVLELYKHKENIISHITNETKKLMKTEPIGSIVLGCGGLATLAGDIEKELEKNGYYLPVIDPLQTSINFAIFLHRTKLRYSRGTYPEIIRKKRII